MKKILSSSALIMLFAAYAAYWRMNGPAPRGLAVDAGKSGSAAAAQGGYKNGTYTGVSADAYYGNVQVQAVIRNGQLADVRFLDYPQDRNHSVEINMQAMPYLKSEAIAAQSAPVDTVTGATETSGAFNQSLASALAQAQSR